MAKTSVSGRKPKVLNFTQTSVVCVRQISSLRTARARKKNPQRQVRLPPAFLGDAQRAVEHDLQQRLLDRQADEQRRAEQQIERGRLDLDQRLVVQDQRQRAEDRDDDRGDERHDRQPAQHRPRDDQRRRDARHQHAGGGENAEPRKDGEEQRQRPELERELDPGVERLARRGGNRHRECMSRVSHPSYVMAAIHGRHGRA